MKKLLIWVIVILATIVALCGLYMIVTGSLETFPTQEQVEKSRIIGWVLFLTGAAVDAIVPKLSRYI
ncbi:MAG: hypothetical protein IKO16_01375 [Lachnospiraceae bacterium]|nr:hypothetical protein [Lachnospiraceae bacterium]